jgi:hypothetical protein
MKEVFSNILLHEGVVADWTQKLSTNIDHDGIMKNPIIVTRYRGQYIALDGFASQEGLEVTLHRDYSETVKNIQRHRSCFGILTREGQVYELHMTAENRDLDNLIRALKDFEEDLDRRNLRIVYVAEEQSTVTFRQHEYAFCLFKRPFFTKEKVVKRTIEGNILPRKSTRHLFPLRPLRIDIDFILLKEDVDLDTKNKLLQARLNCRLEQNMVRYYPESILILSG